MTGCHFAQIKGPLLNPIYFRILQFGGAFAAVVGLTAMITNESIASGITELGIGVVGIYMGTVLSQPDRAPREWPLTRVRALIGAVLFTGIGLAAILLGISRGGWWIAVGAVSGAACLLLAVGSFVLVRRLSQ